MARYIEGITKEFLEEKYLVDTLSAKAIGQLTGVSGHTICDRLVRYGIERRFRVCKHDKILTKDFLIREYIKKNKSKCQIAQMVNCGATTIFRYLRKYDLQRADKYSDTAHKKGITKQDWAYLAGFIDGEGYITITKRPPDKRTRAISLRFISIMYISNTRKEVLFWIRETFGGWVSKGRDNNRGCKNAKLIYTYQATCERLYWILKKIYPYLKLKKYQAELIFELQKLKRVPRGAKYLTEENLGERECLYQEMKRLNKRGRL